MDALFYKKYDTFLKECRSELKYNFQQYIFNLIENSDNIPFYFENLPINTVWPINSHKKRIQLLDIINVNKDEDTFLKIIEDEQGDSYIKKIQDSNSMRKHFRKWHKLFYSIKNNGFNKKLNLEYHPITCIKFSPNVYFRINGSHRCTVLKYFDKENIHTKVVNIEDILREQKLCIKLRKMIIDFLSM